MTEKQITMPVSVLNYSSLTQLLRNPIIFKMKDILGVYTSRRSMSSMIGSACHEALRVYYGGNENVPVPSNKVEARTAAIAFGIQYLDQYPDAGIKYGKTGSREKMLQGYAQAMQFYFAEEPHYEEIVCCEEKMTGVLKTSSGQELPLPASGQADLVVKRADGKYDIIDTKFVTAFTPFEDEEGLPYEDYVKIIQAQFMIHLVKAAKGIKAERVIFREVKRTLNQDKNKKPTGKPQIQDWAVDAYHEPYQIFFYNIYKEVVRYLQNDPLFLPNLSDPFDGQEAGLMYAQGLISADMSDVEVVHRVRDIAFTSKRFLASRLDRAENESLLPEERIATKLREFGLFLDPQKTQVGNAVTQYRFKVSAGTSMTSLKKRRDEIRQALKVKGDIRLLTPIPGTALFGVEVENDVRKVVKLSKDDLTPGTLMLPIGVDVDGTPVKVPLDAMPHLLIAGATGSGKSVLMHNILDALTKQMDPSELHLRLIDPKRVELARFARRPHLHGSRVIVSYEQALLELLSLVDTMDERYQILERAGKRDIGEYNETRRNANNRMPYIVLVVDEFADFMLRSKMEQRKKKAPSYGSMSLRSLKKELNKRGIQGSFKDYEKGALIDLLEESDAANPLMREDANIELLMVRLAQLGRAAGIHIILATQRPSVDVITGLIKANFPVRIALLTSSAVDSTVILGKPGAEKLAGKGDMLFQHPALKGEQRLQGYALAKK